MNEYETRELLAQRKALTDRRDGLKRLLDSADFVERVSPDGVAELTRDLLDAEELLEWIGDTLRPALN